jgi:glycosyltransferase involved in cell wall biosynthesis
MGPDDTLSEDFEYTIAMCNLNNENTLKESIRSIASQVDDRFELLIVDDGSTDGSLSILESLESRIPNLRYVTGSNINLGEARNHSFREANGNHILESLDLDDKYNSGILDFVELYERLRDNIEKDFYLKGNSINIAPKDLLQEYPYRSMRYGEDTDLWRRLFADEKIIWLDHEPFYEQLRDDYTLIERMSNIYKKTIVDFRSGISFWSFIHYCMKNMRKNADRNSYLLTISLPAYLSAIRSGRFDPPSHRFRKKGALKRAINDKKINIKDLESRYGISTDDIDI